jgi:hypothetical protein
MESSPQHRDRLTTTPDAMPTTVIVVGIDGSDSSWDAFWWASGEAHRMHGRVVATFVSPTADANVLVASAALAGTLFDYAAIDKISADRFEHLKHHLLDRSPERELLPMADAFDLPVFAWGPLAEGRLTGKYLRAETGRVTEFGYPFTSVGSDDIVCEVVAISEEIGCSPAQVAISWVRQQRGPVIPLIAARTEEQFRDNLDAIDVHLSQQHLDRLDALSHPTLGFPADVVREDSIVSGIYGAQLPDIDDPRAQAVLSSTTSA